MELQFNLLPFIFVASQLWYFKKGAHLQCKKMRETSRKKSLSLFSVITQRVLGCALRDRNTSSGIAIF